VTPRGTTVLYLPNEKLLVTGDAVSYPIPYVTPPPSRQARSLRALAQLDVDVIVPGRGPAFRDKRFIALEAQLLESVVREVRAALRKGVLTLDEIQREVTAEELREQFTHNDADLDARYRDRVKYIVRIAIREARDGQDLQ
jgi:glyoxylase-like metal-dependent hydrolase (beta-lactamase superfamily II)